MSLLSLPTEILVIIAKNLPLEDLSRLIRSSRVLSFLLRHVLLELATHDRDGLTALQWAADRGYEGLVRLLLDSGFNADEVPARSRMSRNPLTMAALKGYRNIVKYLIERGADVNARGGRLTLAALHWVCKQKRRPENMVKLLLKQGADVNMPGICGRRPLHYAAKNGNTATMRILLDYGADVNAQDEEGQTPLHFCLQSLQEDALELLVKEGADVTICDTDECTVLHYAAGGENVGPVRLILEYGGRETVNLQSSAGWTPIFFAAHEGGADIMKLLLENGADLGIRCDSGETVMMFAEGPAKEVLLGAEAEDEADYEWAQS